VNCIKPLINQQDEEKMISEIIRCYQGDIKELDDKLIAFGDSLNKDEIEAINGEISMMEYFISQLESIKTELKFQYKESYGRKLFYPDCDASEAIVRCIGCKSLTEYQLEILSIEGRFLVKKFLGNSEIE
jgi:hypothetical protein